MLFIDSLGFIFIPSIIF